MFRRDLSVCALAALFSASPAVAAPVSNAAVYSSGEYNISIAKIAVDNAGNVYAIGSQLVTVGSYIAKSVFVTKTDSTGATVYITRLGGKGEDIALGIGVDASGRVFGAGYTQYSSLNKRFYAILF